MDTFAPINSLTGGPIAPALSGYGEADALSILTSNPGDGYLVTTVDGLMNVSRKTVSLSFSPLRPVDAIAIASFVYSHVGAVFLYQLPDESAPRKWICTSMQRGFPDENLRSVTLTLEERFQSST